MWERVRPWLFPEWCVGCAAGGTALCPACGAALRPERFVLGGLAVVAAGAYDGPLRAAILALKRGERGPLEPLAALAAPLLPPGAGLVPVPTSRRRAAERGFDQARALALRVARRSGVAVHDVLRKTGAAQRGRDRLARLDTRHGFTTVGALPLGAAVVLLDDVVTTGATLRAAAATLAAAGVAVAGAVVLARTPERETAGAARKSHQT